MATIGYSSLSSHTSAFIMSKTPAFSHVINVDLCIYATEKELQLASTIS